MVIATANCGQYGHQEFVLEADDEIPAVYLRNIVETVERMVAQGSVFRPGQTFQIGWMLTLVQAHDASRLTLHEPDMQTMPIKWISGITQTLRQMMVQLFSLDSVSLRHEMDIPSVQQSLLVCTRYAEPSFFMERLPPSEENTADTGWFVGCTDQGHDHNAPANLHCMSVYEAYLHQRRIHNFITFPVGSLIVMDREHGLEIMKDRKTLTIEPGSFLEQWQQRSE